MKESDEILRSDSGYQSILEFYSYLKGIFINVSDSNHLLLSDCLKHKYCDNFIFHSIAFYTNTPKSSSDEPLWYL